MARVVQRFLEVGRRESDPDVRIFICYSGLSYEAARSRWRDMFVEVRGFLATHAPTDPCVLTVTFVRPQKLFIGTSGRVDIAAALRLGTEAVAMSPEEFYPRILAEYSGDPPHANWGYD